MEAALPMKSVLLLARFTLSMINLYDYSLPCVTFDKAIRVRK